MREQQVLPWCDCKPHSILSQLPIDGQLDDLRMIQLSLCEDQGELPFDILDNDDHLASTFLPMPVRGVTVQEVISQSIGQQQSTPYVSWPATDGSPVNEFTTEGYMS